MHSQPRELSKSEYFSIDELRATLLRAMALPIDQTITIPYSDTLLIQIERQGNGLRLRAKTHDDSHAIVTAHINTTSHPDAFEGEIYLKSPTNDRRNGAIIDLASVEGTSPDELDSMHAVARDFLLKAQECIRAYIAQLESHAHYRPRKVTEQRAKVTREMRRLLGIK